jgi:hypothetical protein
MGRGLDRGRGRAFMDVRRPLDLGRKPLYERIDSYEGYAVYWANHFRLPCLFSAQLSLAPALAPSLS